MNHNIESMRPSASMALTARAKELQKQDPGIIGLAGGEPDFDTPYRISMAAIRSLTEGNTHYSFGPGIPELREAIAKKLREEDGIPSVAQRVLVTPGAKNAIYLAVNALLNAGDEVLLLDPSWVSYEPIVQSAGGRAVRVKLDYRQNYAITRQLLEQAVTERTRLLILNYPNNPTGRILHPEEADTVEAFLLAHPQVYLLSDEVYEAITYGDARSISLGGRASIADRVITVNGFSKSVAMTGWRLGYLHANEEIYATAFKLYQHSLSCANSFVQVGAVEAFRCQEEIAAMVRVYRQRRDLFIGTLNSTRGVHCESPEGAFYAWVFFDVPGMNADEMAEYLMTRARVVGLPGTAFGEERACCMRFSFANATEDVVTAAKRIKEAIEALG